MHLVRTGVKKLLGCNSGNPDFEILFDFPLFLFMINVLCMRAENVDRGSCTEFVSIMQTYHNYSKMMH